MEPCCVDAKNLREKIKADIPPELLDKLPTEENVTDLKTLKNFLKRASIGNTALDKGRSSF